MSPRSHNRDDTFVSLGWIILGSGGTAFADTDIDFDTVAPGKPPPRGFMIRTTGDVKVTSWDGTVDTFFNGELAVGVIHPLSVRRIWATGTNILKCSLHWIFILWCLAAQMHQIEVAPLGYKPRPLPPEWQNTPDGAPYHGA